MYIQTAFSIDKIDIWQRSTKMKALKKFVTMAIASTFLAAATCLVGCSKNGATGTFSSSYNVDYKMGLVRGMAGIIAEIKGPAAKLAVILTDPKGKSNVRIIEKEQMISNGQTVELLMNDIQAGTWVLTVKTVDPERIVCPPKEIILSPSRLTTIKGVSGHFNKQDLMGTIIFGINNLCVAVNKEGTLPIRINRVELTLNGKRTYAVADSIITDQEDIVNISIREIFKPGERRVAKIKIFYDENRKSLEFEKELVAPQA